MPHTFPNLAKILAGFLIKISKLSQFSAFKNWQNCSFQNWYQIGISKLAKGGISTYLAFFLLLGREKKGSLSSDKKKNHVRLLVGPCKLRKPESKQKLTANYCK